MQPDRIRIIVVGTGGIGDYHVRIWNDLLNAELVGVFDVNHKLATKVAAKYNVPKTYNSLDEAVAAPNVDAIDICTPNMFHKQGVITALSAGKHCLCEKPLAVEAAEIEEMIAARDASGKLLCTIQHMRFEERTTALKRIIDAGHLGDVYYTRACWLRRRMAPTTPGFLRKDQAGFGPGIDIGVHVLDLAMFLLNHPRPVSASATISHKLGPLPNPNNEWGPYDHTQFEVEDFLGGFIRFDDGSALSLEASWLLNMKPSELRGIWLHGTAGGATWPDLELTHSLNDALIDSRVISPTGDNGHKNQLSAFADAIITGGPSPVPAEQSLTVALTLTALYNSAAQNKELPIPTCGTGL